MSYSKGDIVYWIGLQGVVEDVSEHGVQVKFLEPSQRFKRPVERWITFNFDGTYLSGQNQALTKIPEQTHYGKPIPDYDIVKHLEELDTKLSLVLDCIEHDAERYKGEA